MRPRLLDLGCGAGGASVGYHRAGFDVVGVDINPQPNYPFEFVQADMLTVGSMHLGRIDVVHASPPCQSYSSMSACRPGLAEQYAALIAPVRDMLQTWGLPYVIENVEGAPLAGSDDLFGTYGVTLCGRMFGLDLYRHRLFETNFPIGTPEHPRHIVPASAAGHWEPGTIMSVAGHCSPIEVAREAMGIDWMSRDELGESIPPAYTQFVGEQLVAHWTQRFGAIA